MSIFRARLVPLSLAVTLTLLSAAGCKSEVSSPTLNAPGEIANPRPPVATEEPLVYAQGWDGLKMIANMAETELDVAGHFKTSRNACGFPQNGSLELSNWNKLASAMNAALKAPPAEKEYCIALPEPTPGERYRAMDGVVDVIMPDGTKKPLFDTKGNEACTTLGDKDAAKALLTELHVVVARADKEEATCGW